MHNSLPQLAPVDIGIIIFYLIANALVGLVIIRKRRGHSGVEEYILAGRTLTLPAFVATLVSTWYGGIIGVGEYTYDNGIVMWVVFGIPYYVAGILFAFFLAKRVNSDREHVSIPDRMRAVYGPRVGYISAVVTTFMTSPAAYIMMLATLYEWFFGISYEIGILIAIVSSIVYLFYGGFRASVRADILQFVIMFAGFAIIIPFAVSNYGGFGFLEANLPHGHLKPFGSFSIWYVLVWYIGALTTLADPNIHQRVFAARTANIAKRGILISVGFWILFDFMTNTAGLYAKAAFPSLAMSRDAYPALAEAILPMGVKGVFYTGMLATVLSTVDSFFFTSATIIGRDILWRIFSKDTDENRVNGLVRIGLILTAVISVIIILLSEKIYLVWYAMSSILVPAILLPLIFTYVPTWRRSALRTEVSMLAGGGAALIIYMVGVTKGSAAAPEYLLGIEPVYVGLILNALCLLIPRKR
jgi:solute:Na+ symporter, SSS family